MIHGFVVLLVTLLTAISSFAEVYIDGDSAEKIDFKHLVGTYTNRLGYKTHISVREVRGQKDLFEKPEYEIIFGYETGAFFESEQFGIDLDAIEFREVRENGDVVFTVDEDCDYNTCYNSSGKIIFKKNRSGSYIIKIELFSMYWDYETSLEDIEKQYADKRDPMLAFCEDAFPKIVASNVEVYDRTSNQCSAEVTIWLGKAD